MLSRNEMETAMARASDVRPVLRKLADKVARGVALPSRFSVGELGYAAQRELEGLLGVVGKRTPDGRVSFQLTDELRKPSVWQGAIDYFGLTGKDDTEGEDVFGRLKLLLPETAEALDLLAGRDDVSHFVADRENAKDWMRLFRHVVEKRLLRDNMSAITLSQLGSDCFGDSKKLRTGALRRQLAQILGVFGDMDPADEKAVFARFGIIDNPYTTHVTLFVPVALRLKSGKTIDFPVEMFDEGFACQLPLETINSLADVGWDKSYPPVITTCENAAPFLDFVQCGIPCVYTEGYPNCAVRKMLAFLHECGVGCIHAGDADLDGFNIAHEVDMSIPVEHLVADEVLDMVRRKGLDCGASLTGEQRRRAESFLNCNPHCTYAGSIRKMLDLGRWIEQEEFGKILGEGRRRKR